VNRGLGVAAVLATQATYLSHSSKVTSTSTNISVRTSSSTRGSFLSSSSSTVRTTSKEEINISVRATRQPIFLPSNQPEQPSSASARKKSCMFPLWGTRPLGESLPKESSSASASSQYPSQTECNVTRRQQPWVASCPVWKGEPLGGQHNPGDSRSGTRYIFSRLQFCKCLT
jgi:hypothetical protein